MTTPVDVDAATRDSLSGLSTGDLDILEEGLKLREMWQERSGLDPRSYAMCKIAATTTLSERLQ